MSLSLQGWYIVTYALGIYLLNLFIAFLTPKIDPALQDYDGKLVCFRLLAFCSFLKNFKCLWALAVWLIHSASCCKTMTTRHTSLSITIQVLISFFHWSFKLLMIMKLFYSCFVEDGPSLPTKSSEEFKPFMRRLPEFKFW